MLAITEQMIPLRHTDKIFSRKNKLVKQSTNYVMFLSNQRFHTIGAMLKITLLKGDFGDQNSFLFPSLKRSPIIPEKGLAIFWSNLKLMFDFHTSTRLSKLDCGSKQSEIYALPARQLA
jgi:hypothetical protein